MKRDDRILQNKLDDLESILEQIVVIDQAESKEDAHREINVLLENMGHYSGAERTYIFENVNASDVFTNTYEWCADGVVPQIDNLQNLTLDDIPVWYSMFKKGENIIIEDLEQVKTTMPSEYEILKFQDIKTEISFPIRQHNQILGFIGMDNPSLNKSQSLISLLALVSGHLGGIWKSMRADQVLEEKQKELTKEKQYSEVLSRDYTSVYDLDFETYTMRVLKLDGMANASRFLMNPSYELDTYNALVQKYLSTSVLKEYVQDFWENFCLENLEQELAHKERISMRYRSVPNANGNQYFEVQAIRVNAPGKPLKIILGFHHIDEIIEAEQRHQEELEKALDEAKLNYSIISAIGKIYTSIFRINLKGDWYEELSSDSEIHKLTGNRGTASEKMMELCDQFVTPEYHDRVKVFYDVSTLKERLRQEETIAMEYLDKDGSWILARFIVRSRDSNGDAEGILYVTCSIDDEKRREQNWIIIAEEANRANKAKTDFLSRMAHDIRTPLNAVRGFTTIAKSHIDDIESVKNDLDKIDTAGGYLQQLIDDVLDMSRIESGQMHLEPGEIHLSKSFKEYEDIIRPLQNANHISMDFIKHDITYDCIIADEMRLRQIYMNLLSNAMKYTPDGGQIEFELWQELIPGANKVRLLSRVSDTGIGMSPEYMKNMYNKFTRAIDTRVNKVRGSGLGLAIVKELVDLMNGTIDVKSEIGKGTTFKLTFEFPYVNDTKKDSPETGLSDKPDHNTYRNMHLLVAEDNDLNYEVVKELLAMHGITCEHAQNGEECVKMFQEKEAGTYNAILMDLQMPVMDGIEATKCIRAMDNSKGKTIPIIAMTANAFDSDVQKCKEAGMNRHLSKPIDMQELLEELGKYNS